jgi:hypothetical protein
MERKESSMSRICWSAVVLAVVLGNSVVTAKPPDLPGDSDVRCREAGDGNANRLDPEQCEGAQQARELYEAARRCTRAGNLDQARARLRAAHMANPTCHYGQLAIKRLLDLEAVGSDEEQQSDEDESSQAERAFRRVRDTTQPLGMVRAQTY